MAFFLGRKEELTRLHRLTRLKKANLVVIKGRRRVGKSTLVKEFSKGKKFISLSGNPPQSGITAQTQRDEFADQLCTQLGLRDCAKITYRLGNAKALGIERSKVGQYCNIGPLSIVQFRGFGVVQSAGYFCTAPKK